MKDRRTVIVLGLILVLSSACSYNRAYVSYGDYEADIPLSTEGWKGVRLGKVTAREGGAIWRECTSVAEGSLFVLIEETRRLGGNAVGEIRWIPRQPDRVSEEPTCTRRWGWFLVWPVLATHLFQTASSDGISPPVSPRPFCFTSSGVATPSMAGLGSVSGTSFGTRSSTWSCSRATVASSTR
jgi:hypothetical protein